MSPFPLEVSTAPVAVAVLTIIVIYALYGALARRRLPPGPRALPLVGNVHQLPMEYQEKTFFEWGKTYGECYQVLLIRFTQWEPRHFRRCCVREIL